LIVGFLIVQMAKIDFDRHPRLRHPADDPHDVSISHGIGYGFLALVLIKLLSGKPRDVHPLMWLTAAAFGAQFVWG
jgi:AGZA family xanthine/uracil permease-like MFS transporter